MDFAISIPQYVDDGRFDAAAFRKHLTRAEELGFHSAWAQEQILGCAAGVLEQMERLAAEVMPVV
jgi:hypothetical protein